MNIKDFLKRFKKFKGVESVYSGEITADEFIDQFDKKQFLGELEDYAYLTHRILIYFSSGEPPLYGKNNYVSKTGNEAFKNEYGVSYYKYKSMKYEDQKKIVLDAEKMKLETSKYPWTHAAVKYIDTYIKIFNDEIL